MKRTIFVLFGAAIVVMCFMITGHPGVAESGQTDSGRVVESKGDSAIQGEKININTANLKTLITLKNIGPERAKRIIDYRTENGNFKAIDDLKKVKGIGDKTYSQISSLIRVK